MNAYRHKFYATCPKDGEAILYDLIIETSNIIMTEDIVTECTVSEPVFQEALADRLIKMFGGRQTIVATHTSVEITTTRFAL